MAVQAWRLRMILEWRRYLPPLVDAIREVFGDVEAYIFGSAIEGRLTVDSDIDILIVIDHIPRSGLERARLIDRLWKAIEIRGVSPWYPFEFHLITRDEMKLLEKPILIRIL